jgi:uncharacterized membrane protein HdeD (DUF308 family)
VLVEGIAGITAGLVTLTWSGINAIVLLYLIAAWAIVTGISGIMAAIDVRKELENEWFLALSGTATLIFGVLLALQPSEGPLALTSSIGVYGIVFGISLLLFSLRLRVLDERILRRTTQSA